MWRELRTFMLRGNVVDMAVGIIIGVAFGSIVKSFVDDILMPPVGLLTGNVDFSDLFVIMKSGAPAGPYATLADAKAAGAVTLRYGIFFNAVLYFVIIALAMFLFIKVINHVSQREQNKPAPAPATKECPFCAMQVALKATRCPHCTSPII